MSDTKTALFFGCPHMPLHDKAATDWCAERIGKIQPDYVCGLGDWVEANASSRWPDAEELNIALESEFDTLNEWLVRIRKAAPKAKRYARAGNHDANILGKGRIDQRVRSLCNWASKKNVPEWEHWTVDPRYLFSREQGCTWLGPQLCWSHGYETTPARVQREAMYFTKNAPYAIYIAAHTHRPHDATEVKFGDLPMSRWHLNVGCLRDMEPDYMARKPKWNWGHAISVVEFKPLKSPRMCREWDARLEVLRFYDDGK